MHIRISRSSIQLLAIILFGTFNLFGQTPAPTGKPAQKIPNKRVNIYSQLGSVELPEGYKAYYGEGFIDAWFGRIVSSEGKFKIGWSAGTVEQSLIKYKKEFEWIKTETIGQNTVTLGLMRDGDDKRMVAGIGWIEFTGIANSEAEKDLFMQIIGSYQKGRCETCPTAFFKADQK